MKFYIKILEYGNTYSIDDEVNKFRAWFEDVTPYELEIEREVVVDDLDIKHKVFKTDPDGKEWYGLDGIKDQLRHIVGVEPNSYHAVMFLYHLEEPFTKGQLGAWAYFNTLEGNQFTEIPMREYWEQTDGIFRMMTHEIIHLMFHIAHERGVTWVRDTMDLYDKENDVFAPDGNRARNLAVLEPYWVIIGTLPLKRKLMGQLILALEKTIDLMTQLIAKKKTSRIEDWARAIERYENMDKSYNNAGALRYSPLQAGQRNGFAYFTTYEEGWKALIHQLTIAVEGKSQYYHPDMTLVDFFRVYAPVSDNNDSDTYALFVIKELGISTETKIKELA